MVNIAQIPLSLYVHIPWCIKKCPYCDFNSHVQTEPPWRDYANALLDDLGKDYSQCNRREIATVFFGGGTPSLMPGDIFEYLLRGIRERVELSTDAEITLEANPGSIDADNFYSYYQAGVNRLSIGAQSFRNHQLSLLGRVHKVDAIMKTYLIAQSIGFENLNIDLMHSLPHDSLAGCISDLKHALALKPNHISWYELTIEEGTGFEKAPPDRPRHDEIIDQHEHGIEILSKAGYERYEVSAFATAGAECKHNLNYWQFGDYIGIGAGAHGKLSTAAGICRTEKRRSPISYLKAVSTDEHVQPHRYLSAKDLVTDFMMNTLRLNRGFSKSLFTQRTGLQFEEISEVLALAEDKNFVRVTDEHIELTDHGMRFLNDLQLLFYD
ncbi:MAG: radical SAM family heme chaperone HemW [Gammaproteobacteria bacterium]